MTINIFTHYFGNFRRVGVLFFILIISVALLFILLSFTQAAEPEVERDFLCVKPGGGDGCLASISEALAIAQDEDTIRVACGLYTENVFISRTVRLEGGWNADFNVRDIDIFTSTIAPADNSQPVVSIQGVFGSPQDTSPTLEGFAITGGRADLGSNHGGGLSIRDSDAVVISNTVYNNVAFLLGGGVWVQRGGPLLQGNRIQDNQSVGLGQEAYGGGVQLENSAAALMSNQIAGNIVSGTQSYGGGLAIIGQGTAAVALQDNFFFSNTAGLLPDGGFGGAISLINGSADLQNNRVSSNKASENGGGLYLSVSSEDCCQLSSLGDYIQANRADRGGGLYQAGGSIILDGGLVFSNTAVSDGAGFLISVGSQFSISNSAVIANVAGQDGGAIYSAGSISLTNSTLSGNSAVGMGGGLANMDSAYLLNSTVADNESSAGAGLMNAGLLEVKNTLIAQNQGDNCLGGLFSLGNNLEDGGTCAMGHQTDQNNTASEINSLANNGGNTATHALMPNSPAIDSGDNGACLAVDQRGVPRPLDGNGDGTAVCDIGAFEFAVSAADVYMPLVLYQPRQ